MDQISQAFIAILSLISIIVFFIMAANISAMKKSIDQLKYMADQSLKKFEVIRTGNCSSCGKKLKTYHYKGDKVKCPFCRKEIEIDF